MKALMNVRSAVLLTSLALAACSKGRLEVDINKSVQANAAAADHISWESSEYNPMALFGKWQLDRADKDDVCGVLKARSNEDLTLFEEEIKKEENLALVAPCREELLARLDGHWKTADAALEEVSLSFKFKPVLETRDFSQGYYAVNGDVAPKEIVLTFDDGPHGEYTENILKTLKQVDAKAMFFAMGKSVRKNPEALKKVAAAGHIIGSHSMTHSCLPSSDLCQRSNGGRRLSYAEGAAEIMGGHQAVYDVLGWVDPIFRFPYGESSVELKKLLKSKGVGEFYWSIDSNDWRNQSVEGVIQMVMDQVKSRNRGIILFHDIQHKTTLALPRVLSQLYFGGYNLVVVNSETAMKDRKNSGLVKLKSDFK